MNQYTKRLNTDINAYIRLANAVIAQAARDYASAIKSDDLHQISSLEIFFRSEWFAVLTEMDGDYLIRRIRKYGIKGRPSQKICSKSIRTCDRCGRAIKIHARGLCSGCYSVMYSNKKHDNYTKQTEGA